MREYQIICVLHAADTLRTVDGYSLTSTDEGLEVLSAPLY